VRHLNQEQQPKRQLPRLRFLGPVPLRQLSRYKRPPKLLSDPFRWGRTESPIASQEGLSRMLLERLCPAVIGLERTDLAMACDIHHAENVGAVMQS
jgi:hypothetical protein